MTVPRDAASSTASQVSPVAPSGGVTASPSRDESYDLSIINFRVGPLGYNSYYLNRNANSHALVRVCVCACVRVCVCACVRVCVCVCVYHGDRLEHII